MPASSNLELIDYLIILLMLGVLTGFAVYTSRYTRCVADFLSANRCAGRYLLTVASTSSGLGVISIIAFWEQYYQAGFTAMFWLNILAPIGLLLSLSGWIIYRYRETRALTLAQFLEMRYSKRFRLFSGSLCWLSGMLNYGIFPAVTARFFIYFFGLPVWTWTVPGTGLALNLTLGLVMAIMLGCALMITLSGGQISVMVTDFIQGQISSLVFVLLLGVLLFLFPWGDIVATLKMAPAGHSMLNPFQSTSLPDFNPFYFMIMAFLMFYQHMVWQGSQGYNASAITPHEARMAVILASFRMMLTMLLIALAAICAHVMMNSAVHPEATRAVETTLAGMGDAQMAKQMTTTVVMSQILPHGVLGLLAAVMLMASIATDTTYLHSWGSIFIQDVLRPAREARGKQAHLPPEVHLRWLRRSILGVALFVWTFSMLFPLRDFIMMYFQATGAIYLGGGGAVLIGGLYWKRGTTTGAWAAMIVGSTMALGGILLINIIWPTLVPALKTAHPDAGWIQVLPATFWLNGVQMAFAASLCAITAYVCGSLLSPDPQIEMDKLLHRGKYRVTGSEGVPDHFAPVATGWRALLPSSEFTRGDRIIYWLKLGWTLFFFISFLIICAWQLIHRWPDAWWANWWLFNLVFIGAAGTCAVVWFLIGGIRDLRAMFHRLSTIQRDNADDGTVDKTGNDS
jgi:SSS family solute:Na+ symporter